MTDETRSAKEYRAWHYGPHGEAEIFTDPAAIPEGWRDHPFESAQDRPFAESPRDKVGGGRPRKRRGAQ